MAELEAGSAGNPRHSPWGLTAVSQAELAVRNLKQSISERRRRLLIGRYDHIATQLVSVKDVQGPRQAKPSYSNETVLYLPL